MSDKICFAPQKSCYAVILPLTGAKPKKIMKTVSFAKLDSATEEVAVPPAVEEKAAIVAQSNAAVPQSESVGTYHGEDDGVDSSDVRLPRLKLLQGTSDKKQLASFGFAAFVLKDVVRIASAAAEGVAAVAAKLVFVKLISKTYSEKVAKFGDPSGFARSLAEVDEQGGTTDWRLSKENRQGGDPKKGWYQVNANCLVLVEKPEDAEDDHFPFEADGKFYAPALYSVKSFAYDRFFVALATAKATGELRKGGWSSRFVLYTPEIEVGKGNSEFAVPSVKFGEHTSAGVQAIAAELV